VRMHAGRRPNAGLYLGIVPGLLAVLQRRAYAQNAADTGRYRCAINLRAVSAEAIKMKMGMGVYEFHKLFGYLVLGKQWRRHLAQQAAGEDLADLIGRCRHERLQQVAYLQQRTDNFG
jgi:hypothetical protein